MRKTFIALFILVFMTSNLYASQAMIAESDGYACLGEGRTRKQTETAAMTAAKRNAIEKVQAFVSSATKDLELKDDFVSAYANATAGVIKELKKGWYKDASAGDCYWVKIKAEVIPNIKKTGLGTFISSNVPPEIQKQEAFVSAFFDGIGQIAGTIARIEKRDIFKWNDKKMISIVHERIGKFEIYSQTNAEDFDVKADFIDVNYRGQKFVVFNYQLMYPSVELTKFIKWNNPPKTISDIRIEDVKWLEDGECEVSLSYSYKLKKAKAETPRIHK